MKTTNLSLTILVCGLIAFSGCKKADDLGENGADDRAFTNSSKNHSSVNALLAQVRTATAQFHSVEAAMEAGYESTEDCISGPPGVGAMGVHFVKFPLLDDVHNPLEPEVLVYEIKNNGSYKLVAVEYLHVGADAPMFGGEVEFHPFPAPFADYALHAWVWKGNPNGVFEDWNINVTCP